MLGAAFAYATLPVCTKVAYDHGADPIGILVVRFAVAAPALTAIVAARGARPRARPPRATAVAGLTALFFVQTWTFFLSLEHMAAVLSVLLLFLYPILVWWGAGRALDEPLTRSGALVAVAGTAGVALSVGISSHATAAGVGFGLTSAVTFAAYMLGSKRAIVRGADGLALAAAVYAGAAACYVALALVHGVGFPADLTGWAAVAGTTLGGTLTAGVLFTLALSRLPAGPASIVSAAEPAMAVALAAAVLGESMRPLQILGMCILCAAIGSLGRQLLQSPA